MNYIDENINAMKTGETEGNDNMEIYIFYTLFIAYIIYLYNKQNTKISGDKLPRTDMEK